MTSLKVLETRALLHLSRKRGTKSLLLVCCGGGQGGGTFLVAGFHLGPYNYVEAALVCFI